MKKLFGLMFSFAVIAASASFASAQDDHPPMPPGMQQGGGMRMQFQMPAFADLDKNKDKKISKDEFPSQFPAQAFDRLDANHDGFIDEEEFNSMRRGMTMGGPRTGESLTKLLDANTDGKVSREEFAKIESLFDALDKDHNGELNQEELNGFLRAVNEAQAQATGGVEVTNLFDKYDKNKDDKITADEMSNEKTFKALDLNKDGEVSRAEATSALKQIAEQARQKKQPQPPPHQ